MSDFGDYRQDHRWTAGFRVALGGIILVPAAAVLAGLDALDVGRVAVLTATVIVLVMNAVSLWHTIHRLRHLHQAPAVRDLDVGRRDRLVFVILTLGLFGAGIVHRFGEDHIDPETVITILLLLLAVRVALKIDVRRWRALP